MESAKTIDDLQCENDRLKQRVAELELLVSTDTLTPLFNRRYFTAELERWCQRAHRYGGQYGLLFLDIDHLKVANDIQGHSVGDDILRGVAQALIAATRKSDVVARIGGDEFAVLLDSITPEQLGKKADSMRRLLTGLIIETAGPPIEISVSAGHCPISIGSRPDEILAAADRSMYAHKRSKSA